LMCPTSFGVVCFEVSTRLEPFEGLRETQVTRAVADKGKRPQIPEGASASPDVVALMEQCWRQDPAERPEGFGPIVRTLAGVIARVGDPRDRPLPTADSSASSNPMGDGDAPRVGVRTAPVTIRSGADTPPNWSGNASNSFGSNSRVTADTNRNRSPTVSGGISGVSALNEGYLTTCHDSVRSTLKMG